MAAGLVSCGDGSETTSPVEGSPVSIEDYAAWCAESSVLSIRDPAGGDDDEGDVEEGDREAAMAFVAELRSGYESIVPPPELAGWHNATLSDLRDLDFMFALASEAAEDASDEDVTMMVGLALWALVSEAEQAIEQLDLPQDLRWPLVASGCLPLPAPANLLYDHDGSAIVLTWDAVPGADHYNVYHDDFFDSDCRLDDFGNPFGCDELVAGVTGTSYVHTDPDPGENNYWVTACNSGGCSVVDSDNPARPSAGQPTTAPPAPGATTAEQAGATRGTTDEPTTARVADEPPAGAAGEMSLAPPAAAWFSRLESTIVLTWDPVPGATHYNVYYDDFFDSSCSLGLDGSPRFCSELATGLSDTSFVHADPAAGDNYYWVTACNSGGCSGTDEENPARPIEELPAPPAAQAPSTAGVTSRADFDASLPEGYASVDLGDAGSVWGVPARYTSDSNAGVVAYMLVGTLRGCDFAEASAAGRGSVHILIQELGELSDYEAATVCGLRSREWRSRWEGLRITHLRLFDETSPTNVREYVHDAGSGSYLEAAGTPGAAPTASPVAASGSEAPLEPAFAEGTRTVRSAPENLPGGINVGLPVASAVDVAITYTLGGPDAHSFAIVPETGQIRTRDGIIYDAEARDEFVVTVGIVADDGNGDEIEVTILLEDLAPTCRPLHGLRTNHGDRRLTVRWFPAPEADDGSARVLGYETEIRRGDSGPWSGRRTILGHNIDSTVYAGLVNGEGYQVRVRPITAEGDCEWSPPFFGIPADFRSPRHPFDRFGSNPVGDADRHWRILNSDRCRYTRDGMTADAGCTFEITGRHTLRVRLDFDDPTRGSCALSLAFSSLTAGSFLDECAEAGVNTDVPFDVGFRMPPAAPRSEADLDPPQRAPRTQAEFEALVSGRDDFIPGLAFGYPCYYCEPGARGGPVRGWANRIEYDADGTPAREIPGRVDYRSTGPSSAALTFEGGDGRTFVFNLDFEASGIVRATTTDPGGNPAPWPGLQSLDAAPADEPILLPVPPSWDSTIAGGTGPANITDLDAAPDDWGELVDRVYGSRDPDRATPLERLLERALFTTLPASLLGEGVERPSYTFGYTKLGPNRAIVTVDFGDFEQFRRVYPDDYAGFSDYQRSVAGSRLVIHLTFLTEDSFLFSANHLRDGYPPDVTRGLIDLSGDIVNTEFLPDEILPPGFPPQAAGEDRAGVEIAAALSANEIGGNEIQLFLVSDPAFTPDSYRPGDWLEPKDGNNQRMMIVGAGQQAVALSGAAPGAEVVTLAFNSPRSGLASFAVPIDERGEPVQGGDVSRSHALSRVSDTSITQVAVVCMQFGRAIPVRGARYFSAPKQVEGPVQICQRDCALNESENIQDCVWECEEEAG